MVAHHLLEAAWVLEDGGEPQLALPLRRANAELVEALAMAPRRWNLNRRLSEAELTALPLEARQDRMDELLVAADSRRRGAEFDRSLELADRVERLIRSLPVAEEPWRHRDFVHRIAAERWAVEQRVTCRVNVEVGEAICSDAENTRFLAGLTPDEWRIAGELRERADPPGVEGMLARLKLTQSVKEKLKRHHDTALSRRAGTDAMHRAATATRVFALAELHPLIAEALRRWKSPDDMARTAVLLLERARGVTDPNSLLVLLTTETRSSCPRCGFSYALRDENGLAVCGHCQWKEA
jgi:hypothetical protein